MRDFFQEQMKALHRELTMMGAACEEIIAAASEFLTEWDESLVEKVKQIGAQIEQNEIDLLIFLRDPLNPKRHEPDVNDVVKLCDMHNIPMATNLATAELLIKSLDRGDLEWREMYK